MAACNGHGRAALAARHPRGSSSRQRRIVAVLPRPLHARLQMCLCLLKCCWGVVMITLPCPAALPERGQQCVLTCTHHLHCKVIGVSWCHTVCSRDATSMCLLSPAACLALHGSPYRPPQLVAVLQLQVANLCYVPQR